MLGANRQDVLDLSSGAIDAGTGPLACRSRHIGPSASLCYIADATAVVDIFIGQTLAALEQAARVPTVVAEVKTSVLGKRQPLHFNALSRIA